MVFQGITSGSRNGTFSTAFFKPAQYLTSPTKLPRKYLLLLVAVIVTVLVMLAAYSAATNRQDRLHPAPALNPKLVDEQNSAATSDSSGSTTGQSSGSSSSTTTQPGTSTNTNSTNVTVNGQSVNVPGGNGSYCDNQDNTSVCVNTQQSSSNKGGSVTNHQTSTINVQTQ